MIESPEKPPRRVRTVWIIAGTLLLLVGLIGVGLAAAAWIAVPGGAVRTSALIVESADCPVLVLEQPNASVGISGYEWLQEMAGLQPAVEISTAGSIFTTPTETLPELVLGVTHCRLVASDSWKVVTVSGVDRVLDWSSLEMTAVKKSPEGAAVLSPGDLESGSLIVKDPGEVKVQGVLTAPWPARGVPLIAVSGAALMILGMLIIFLGARSRARGKHESHE